jgi:WD40 repeat protein
MAYTFMSHIYLFHLFTGHSVAVYSASLSADGARVVSGSGDKTVRIRNAETGACEVTMESMLSRVSA